MSLAVVVSPTCMADVGKTRQAPTTEGVDASMSMGAVSSVRRGAASKANPAAMTSAMLMMAVLTLNWLVDRFNGIAWAYFCAFMMTPAKLGQTFLSDATRLSMGLSSVLP